MVMGDNEIDDNKKYTSNVGNLDCHAWQFRLPCGCGGAMRVASPNGAHPGLHRSHWMPLLGECLSRIAMTATMVNEFFENTKHYQNNTFS